MSSASRIEGIAGGGRGPGGYSYRGSELTAAERRSMVKQNKSAESLKNKDLDKMDKNKANYAKQKQARADQLEGSYKVGKTEGKVKAAVAAVPVIAATAKIAYNAGKKKGSQDNHHVTTVPPKKNTMNKSERDFEAGQKLKAKITKKTGVYPNTAN